MEQPIQPIVPEGTPLPPAPVGVPPYPITPFAVWTWSTPVIPEFYWNIYSSEQRIKSICKEIGKIEAYLQYLVNATNSNIIELHKRIDVLTERVAALEKKVEEEVARLDALIAQLRADLEQEIQDREAGDEALGERIDQEVLDRTHGDQTLHQEIADEATARTHADDSLHSEISQEVQDRIHADDELHEEISHRLLPTDIQAGEEISITRPDPNSNTLVIASTVAHSIAALENTVSGLQAALTSETEERRADDAALWTAVNERIERGKILAGSGIKVVNDPDESTVTISATGGGTGGGSTTVTGTAPVEVTGDPDEGYTVSVAQATEEAAGVITEARVKELAPSYTAGSGISISGNRISIQSSGGQAPWNRGVNNRVVANIIPIDSQHAGTISSNVQFEPGTGIELRTNGALQISAKTSTESEAGIISEARVKELASGPSLSAEEPLKLEDGKISLTKDPAGPVTSSSAGLSVREITPETESETETGVVSKKTIKSLAQYSGAIDSGRGLSLYDGQVGVHIPVGGINYKSPFAFTPEAGSSVDGGSLILTDENIVTGEKDLLASDDAEQVKYYFREGRTWLVDLGAPGDAYTAWVGGKVKAEYRTSSGAWQDAKGYNGDYFHLECDSSPEDPGRGLLYARISSAGLQAMDQDAWTNVRFKWSIMPVHFGIK